MRDEGYAHSRVIYENGFGYGENTVALKYRGQEGRTVNYLDFFIIIPFVLSPFFKRFINKKYSK